MIIRKPHVEELCIDEMKDFILELISRELSTLPPDFNCRRRELCEAILNCNKPTGVRTTTKEIVNSIVKDWKGRPDQISTLNSYGFKITKGKTHYKMRWHDSEYFKTLPSTPSDRRTGANATSEVNKTFF